MPIKISEERKEEFLLYYNKGMNDYEIARIMGISNSTIFRWRRNLNLPPHYSREKSINKPIELTQENKEILCGTLLGDGSIQYYPKYNWKSPIFKCDHGIGQKEYAELLYDKFINLGASLNEYKRYDKRTNKLYTTYCVKTKANPALFPYFIMLYSTGKKEIVREFLEHFTIKSLAFLYMDDGYYHQDSYYICTDSFSLESIEILVNYIKEKLGLTFTIVKHSSNYRIRLLKQDINKFNSLVSPYIIDSLKYKLKTVS